MGVGVLEVFTQLGNQIADRPTAVELVRANAGDHQVDPVMVDFVINLHRQRGVWRLGDFTALRQKTSFNNAA